MKIAVTYENGNVFQHFGHSEAFKIYDVGNGEIKSSEIVLTNGSGHGALAGFLSEHKTDVLICGGIGGVSGNADDAVKALLSGTLGYNPDVRCNHHDHDHGERQCGEHGCGNNNFNH